ncbi:Ras GTPase activating protein [Saccharomycopsis crataegensis]|uniref:Ras GTPase activating protein n=1 Tax=Saccharomycopsis crataegensis TaxID=43959 RepID=A0AAV5QMG3_9ASCO|nr:Ras GTPase activating protein [Saccharomycopsis crataegensis]
MAIVQTPLLQEKTNTHMASHGLTLSSAGHVSIVDSVIASLKILSEEVARDPISNASVIESEPIYISCKKTLLSLSRVQSCVPYVISSFINLLDKLNRRDNFAYIKKRSDISLHQIFLVLTLLSDFTEANWRLKERSELNSISSHSTDDSDKDFPHRIPPDPLEPKLVMKALQVLVKLKSFKKSRSILRQLNGNSAYFELSSSNQEVADIDYNVDALARYLGAASPAGYSKATEIAVTDNANIDNNDILGYLEFLAYLHLTSLSIEKEFQLLTYFTDVFKNAHIQHTHAYFFIDSVINFAVCYTKDFTEVTSKPSVNKVGDGHFEKMYSKFKFSLEDEKKFYYRALAISLVLMPKQFDVFLNNLDSNPNKSKLLKAANNKKQKFLNLVARNIYEGTEKVPTLEFFLVIFNIASVVIQYEPNHPVVTFAKSYVLQVYNVLNPVNNHSLMNDTDISAIDKIRIEFYSLAIVLAPELIKPKVINIIANPETSLRFYYIITHAIYNLIKRPYHREFAYKLIETTAITLRDHTAKLAQIVRETVSDFDALVSDNSSSTHSLKYSQSVLTSDSRTLSSSKYSSTTLNQSASQASQSVSTGMLPSDSNGTPNFASNYNSNTISSPGNNSDNNSGADLSFESHPIVKVSTKKSRKETFLSVLGKRSVGNSKNSVSSGSSNSIPKLSSKKSVISNKTTNTAKTEREIVGYSYNSFNPVTTSLSGNANSSFNADKMSIHSFNSQNRVNKPISVSNIEYMKRVENNAFLSREILKLVFQIFRTYSSFFFKLPSIYNSSDINTYTNKVTNGVHLEAIRQTKTVLFEMKRILDPLLISLADSDMKLVEKARRLVIKILDAEDGSLVETHLAFFSSLYLQSGFIDISLTSSLHEKSFLETISFITLFWSKRVNIVNKIDMDTLVENIGSDGIEILHKCFADNEKLLLIALETPGTEYYRSLKLICSMYTTELNTPGKYITYLRNSVNYKLFESLVEENYYVSSPMALQKRIRKKLYQNLEVFSEGLLLAMDIVYERWKEYYLIRNPSSLAEQEHRNYAGFLAVVLGGIMKPKYSRQAATARLSELENFISRQVDHLNSDDVHEREAAKDLLANELHPHAHKLMIRNIQKDLNILIKRKEKIQAKMNSGELPVSNSREYLSVKYITLLDSYLSIIIGFLNFGEPDVNFALSVDLKVIALKIISLFKPIALGLETSNNLTGGEDVAVTRLKIKVCKFIQKLSDNAVALVIRGCSIKWRCELIQSLARWLDVVCFGSSVNADDKLFNIGDIAAARARTRHEMDSFVYFELVLECLRAIASLFKETPIYAFGAQYSSEILNVRTTQFSNYFNLFSRVLESCLARGSLPGSNAALSAVERKVELIKEQVIVALSNMLEYNYDIGIDYALPLSFHADIKVKHSFLVVFSNIIETIQSSKRRLTPEFEAASFASFADNFCQSSDLLIAVARGILSTDYDRFANSLLEALISVNLEIPKITDLLEFELEISSPSKVTDTLRRTSVPAKMLSLYAKQVGSDYIQGILRPVFAEMQKKNDWFEVEKLQKDNDLIIEENVTKFFYYLRATIKNICASIDVIPIELRALCANLRRLVVNKIHDDGVALLVISSFLFLRFLCPAIVSPEIEGVIDNSPSKREKRSYMQIAKVFQNIANDSLSSIRWHLLSDKKQELISLKKDLFEFLDIVSKDIVPQSVLPKKNKFIISKSSLSVLYSILIHRNIEIGLNMMHPITKPKDSLKEVMKNINVLEMISIDIGQKYLTFSPEIPDFIRNNKEKFTEAYDLFIKFKDSVDPNLLATPFITQSYTRNGTLLVTFSHKYFQKVAKYDLESLVYRALQICDSKWNEPFVMVVDCSFFDINISQKFAEFFAFMTNVATNFWAETITIIYYNVNPMYSPFLEKSLQKYESSVREYRKFNCLFYSPFDSITTLEIAGLPKASLDVVRDTQITIDCLIYSKELDKYVPVVIKIGKVHVFWSYQFLKFNYGGEQQNVRVTSTSTVDDWVDVTDENFINNDGNEFSVTVKGHGILHLSSSKKSEILKNLFLARLTNRVSDAVDYYPINSSEYHSADSFLGSMLASVLLNMVSSAEEVRRVAFNSLVLIIDFYHLKVDKSIIADGTTFPKDFIPYVLNIASTIAKNHPELTSDFISAITEGYESSESKYCCLMLLSLWIKNIYDQYYKVNRVLGTQKVEDIIHQFITKIPPAGDDLLLTFKTFIWKSTVVDSNLVEFAVTDIIREALKKEVQSEPWDNINSVISFFPTIDVCGLVIKQLKQIVDIPNFKNDRQVSINITWVKTKILVKICESLAFDALFIAETYFPEICFIVSMLINIGPYDLRISVRNLIINVFHSFLSKEGLSEVARDHVLKTIDEFSGPGSKVTFGLVKLKNESYDVLSNRPDQVFGAYKHLETFCVSLLKFIEFQPFNIRSVWKGRWSGYVLSAAFRQHGPLQGRGVLISGMLCKSGISDSVIIEYFRKNRIWISDYGYSDFIVGVCLLLTISNFSEALTKISRYWGVLFWVGIAHCNSTNTVQFQSSLKIVKNLITGMSKNGVVDKNTDLFAKIQEFKTESIDFVTDLEQSFKLSFDSEYSDHILISFCAKGLQVPYIKKNGYDLLCILFKIRLEYDLEQQKERIANGEKLESNAIAYLCFIFISGIHGEDYEKVMKSCGLDNSENVSTTEIDIPRVIIDFFATEDEHAALTMFQLGSYFSHKNTDASSKLRFLLLLNVLNDYAPDIVFYGYLNTSETLVKEIEVNGSIEILQAAYKVVENAGSHSAFENPECIKDKYDEIFEKNNISGIKNNSFPDEDPMSPKAVQKVFMDPFHQKVSNFYATKANAYARVD